MVSLLDFWVIHGTSFSLMWSDYWIIRLKNANDKSHEDKKQEKERTVDKKQEKSPGVRNMQRVIFCWAAKDKVENVVLRSNIELHESYKKIKFVPMQMAHWVQKANPFLLW